MSRKLISYLSAAGLLTHPDLWLDLRLGEDQMMGILCCLADLQAVDFSACGDVFGVQFSGLAFPPDELLRLGYAIIHSVKNDPTHSEAHIRSFFRSRRQ
jgi:hypothetical protein